MKKWYQSKIIWIAVIQAVIAIVALFISAIPEWAGQLLLAKSVLDIVLRAVTTTTLGNETK